MGEIKPTYSFPHSETNFLSLYYGQTLFGALGTQQGTRDRAFVPWELSTSGNMAHLPLAHKLFEGQYSTVVRSSSGARQPGFKSLLYYLLIV